MENSHEDFLNPDLTRQMYEIGYDGSTLMHAGELHGILKSSAFRWFRERHHMFHDVIYVGGLTNETADFDWNVTAEYEAIGEEEEESLHDSRLSYLEAEDAALQELIRVLKKLKTYEKV